MNPHPTRLARRALPGLFVALAGVFVFGCGDGDGDGTDDAVIVGQVEGALHRDDAPRLRLNGDPRPVDLADDDTFAVRDVPTGDLTVEFETDDARGTVTLTDVQAGEVIEVVVSTDDDGRLSIRVTRRAPRDRVPPEQPDESLYYGSKDAVHQLRPGTYHGDLIIDAKNVTVIGARDARCDGENATVLDGDLVIRAKDAHVVDVIVLGRVIIEDGAKDARVVDTCVPHRRHHDDDHHHHHRGRDHDDD
jgi:hypothetical protein